MVDILCLTFNFFFTQISCQCYQLFAFIIKFYANIAYLSVAVRTRPCPLSILIYLL